MDDTSRPEIYIAPAGGGRLTPESLLRSEGSIELCLFDNDFPKQPYLVFRVAGDGFWFNLGFINRRLLFQRCGCGTQISPQFLSQVPGNKTVIASWTPTQLTLLLGHFGFAGPSIRRCVATPPTVAPHSFMRWARRESLLPVIQYDTESSFVERVHSGLALIQDKIDQVLTKNMFWDVEYDGNRIVNKKPKREKDVQSTVHALLSDQFFMSSIDIIPEATTSSGRMDFLFAGSVHGLGLAKVCVEFKSQHSSDLIHGIEYQLPAYMRAQQTRNGAYCLLNFERSTSDEQGPSVLHAELHAAARRGWPDLAYPIKIHEFELGPATSASRL